MKKETYMKIIQYLAVAIIFTGIGWKLRASLGEVYMPLWGLLLIIIGLILIILSFYPKSKIIKQKR